MRVVSTHEIRESVATTLNRTDLGLLMPTIFAKFEIFTDPRGFDENAKPNGNRFGDTLLWGRERKECDERSQESRSYEIPIRLHHIQPPALHCEPFVVEDFGGVHECVGLGDHCHGECGDGTRIGQAEKNE